MSQTYYPKAKEVKIASDEQLLTWQKQHNVGIAFRGFTQAYQHGVFRRAYESEIKKRKTIKHNQLRKILIDYECEEFGDAIIDEICDLFNYPRTEGE